jgi:hypothetical protein
MRVSSSSPDAAALELLLGREGARDFDAGQHDFDGAQTARSYAPAASTAIPECNRLQGRLRPRAQRAAQVGTKPDQANAPDEIVGVLRLAAEKFVAHGAADAVGFHAKVPHEVVGSFDVVHGRNRTTFSWEMQLSGGCATVPPRRSSAGR